MRIYHGGSSDAYVLPLRGELLVALTWVNGWGREEIWGRGRPGLSDRSVLGLGCQSLALLIARTVCAEAKLDIPFFSQRTLKCS